MKNSLSLATFSLLVLVLSASSFGQQSAAEQTEKPAKEKQTWLKPVDVAVKFLESLDEEKKGKAVMEFGSEQRVQWHFIPKDMRKGLPLFEMDESQQKLAMQLLRSTISKVGYQKANKIMQLESVLKKLEAGRGRNERNPKKYYFTIFGKPELKKKWALSFEGHHLSLNFTFRGNWIVDSTPQFYATNPATLMDDYGPKMKKGLQVLKAEEQLGFDLVNALDEKQLKSAMLPGETPSEIRAAGEAQPPTTEARGLAVADMNDDQKSTLEKLLKAYTSKMKPGVSKKRWELITEAGMDEVRFAWSGAMKAGRGHYYVVQGPTFLVEFINVQPDAAGNPANHVHCVWRDMQGDFDLPIGN